jgi:nucleoside-diphosphate-sugar epimerase
MAKILIVGCGDLGAAIAKRLVDEEHEVVGLRRSIQTSPRMQMLQGDVADAASLQALVALMPEIVIYCVAASGQTDAAYQAQYVTGLKNILASQSRNQQLQHVFFVSSTRVYGQETTAILDESITALPADFGGERLLEAEHLLSSLPCNATTLRLSGIYGPGRLRMINLAKSPQQWPSKNSWSNRIHRDDAADFIVFLVQRILTEQAIASCYIVTDSKPVSQYEVLTWLAKKMQLALPGNSSVEAQGGKRLSNQLMLSSGFQLRYPDFSVGYQALINEIATA